MRKLQHLPWLFVMLALSIMPFSFLNAKSDNPFPQLKWVKNVGAKSFPEGKATFRANDYGAVGNALTLNTEAIQKAIDDCAQKGGGIVTFDPGIYLTGSIFIKDNVNFNIPKGTTLIGSQDIADYKLIDTRVAGIEMEWPAALLNIKDATCAAITGGGTVNGKGKVFWNKYGTMSMQYVPKGLRWCVDYDCQRPRGILVSNSEQVTIQDIVLYQAGFWSLHILYSGNVTVDGIIISNNIEGRGPSTDGVDIDSSHDILVQNSNINCNDDNFCLKAGRDSDGIRVNRPCEYVVIRDCVAGHGDGLFTCGSETSGSIRHILAYNLKANGTSCGLRFKSTTQRGGSIEDIYLGNIEMVGVTRPFIVDLNWNPSYSNSVLPAEYEGKEIPAHWTKLITPVSPEQGTPKFRDMYIKNVSAVQGSSCLQVSALEQGTIDNIHFENVSISAKTAGSVKYAKNWTFKNFSYKADDGSTLKIENCEGVNP